MSRNDYGYVMKVGANYRILCNPNVYESGSECTPSSPLYESVTKYVKDNPDKVFTGWTDPMHDRLVVSKEINKLKKVLADTDYCVIRCQELGLDMADEYPDEHRSRADARARINELELTLASM